jgi:membrane dipeptidase
MKLRMIAIAAALAVTGTAMAQAPDSVDRRIEKILKATPLIDGHNDLPWEIRESYDLWRKPLDLAANTSGLPAPLQTDIPRLRQGGVGAQFWSVWIPGETTGDAAIRTTLEEIDIVHRMVERYPRDLEMASTAADIVRIHKAGRIASLVGVEGGHQIGNNPAALRAFYALGARYMTLTHSINNDWADSATADPVLHGLSPFGKAIVHEMNRIGMMLDLSHVSAETMKMALAETKAPVIFSHSGARAVMGHPRNVPDDVLRLLPANGGVVMAVFYPGFVSEARGRWSAERDAETARLAALFKGQPDKRKEGLDAWDSAHPFPQATVGDVADHIEHIRDVAGIDHVGLGSDYDGISGTSPEGMPGVQSYPVLLRELIRRGWSDSDLTKLVGGNLLRVMERVEQVSAAMRGEPPLTATIEQLDRKP